jgi:DNA-binding MarR family transcriptional regulator
MTPEPSQVEYRLFARVLLWLSRQPRIGPMETAPESLTQAAMASGLATSRSNISYALQRLVDGGGVEVRRSHVIGRRQRVKIYQLTPQGEALVAHIGEGMRKRGP